jgi:ER lumen protein retaining receptor
LITQVLYCLVFGARYLDIFSHPIFEAFIWFYLFAVKLFYIGSSVYIVFLMTFVYARTREREKAWKFGIYCLIGAVILATPVCKIFEKGPVVTVGDGNDAFPRFMYAHEFKFTEVRFPFRSC